MPASKLTRALLLSVLALCAFEAAAASPDEVRAACRREHRPCVGLVLSGGGARGFAHVGVIEVLEQLGVRIDVVTGTSMGSMVGGAYAAGFSLEQLRDTVLGVDWDKMLAPRPDRVILPFRRKLDDYKSLPSSGLEIGRDGTPMLPESFVPSEELELFLNDKTGAVAMVNDLSRLSIPFAAPATDLVAGERFVMQKNCTLGEAMRASMSVPGAFAPVAFEGRLLVDGGLMDNLPVALARSMGADVVIAVNVGTPLGGRDGLGSVVGVMGQMVNILTEQNVRASLKLLNEGDVLIAPDLTGLNSTDLKKSDEIIERGRQAAQAAAQKLKRYARPRTEWLAWNEAREQPFADVEASKRHVLSGIRVAQSKHAAASPERILQSADIDVDQEQTNRTLDDAVRRVWANGDFSSVTYRFDPGPNGTELLVIEPKEKRAGYSSLRFGGSVQTNFNDDSTYNLLFAHTWHLLNGWGAEWRNEVQIGEEQRLLSELYQPLGAGSPWFLLPSVEYSREPFDVYVDGEREARRRNDVFNADLMLGFELKRWGYAGVSVGWIKTKTNREIGRAEGASADNSFTAPYLGTTLLIDTLDNINFPTKGLRVSFSGRYAEREAGDTDSQRSYQFEALVPYSIGPWTATVNGEIARSTMTNAFSLGGAQRLSGSSYGRWTGSRLEYGRLSIARDMSAAFKTLFTQPVWLGATLEAGRAWNPSDPAGVESGCDDWRRAASIYIGIDSLVGPLYLSYGRTFGDDQAVYFLWGRRN